MKRANKFGAKKVVVDGLKFDSKREAKRWSELLMLQRAGEISQLERQVAYVLAPPVRLSGETRLKPAIRYFADFRYFDVARGVFLVEDVKSPATAKESAFRIKLHLMKYAHNIDVVLS